MTTLSAAVLLVMLAAACGAEPQGDEPGERPPRSLLIGMIGTPVFRPSERIAQTLSADALETVFRSDASLETVAAWYRTVLIRSGWDIVGDARLPDSSVALHARQEGKPPIWITIRPGALAGTSQFSIIGAAPDTTAADTASGES
ncbi:MAG: hypothetical protein PVF27_07360 [Gemmatimonadales bacterium]|jgi:hypothetical protein